MRLFCRRVACGLACYGDDNSPVAVHTLYAKRYAHLIGNQSRLSKQQLQSERCMHPCASEVW
jgi:hypothetical protein